MGYYTDFEIEVRGPHNEMKFNDDVGNLSEIMTKETGYCWYSNHLSDSKWYDHEKDMIRISETYPDYTFEINGVGEDHHDIWRLYAKNGNVIKVKAVITFPPVPIEFLV